MPTRDQITALQAAAQNILDGQPFSGIQNSIEAAAGPSADDWYAGRIRKMPVAAAFGHLIGARAITYLEVGDVPEQPPGLSPYEQFLFWTQDLDQKAGEEVIGEIPRSSQTLQDAFEYFVRQLDRVLEFGRNNPEKVRRRGKTPAVPTEEKTTEEVAVEALVRQVSANASDIVPSSVVRGALYICLAQGRLPEGDELAQELKTRLGQLASPTTMSGQAFRQLTFGQELTKQHHKALQSDNPADRLVLPEWMDVLNQAVETGTLPPAIRQLAGTLRNNPETEHQRNSTSKVLGHCAAQFLLRPKHPEQARNFFGAQGVPRQDGAFSMAEYQHLRAITVAENTIFSDPAYRRALRLIAEEVRSQTE